MTFKSKWADWKPQKRAGWEPAKPAKDPFDPFAGSHVAHFPEKYTRNGQTGHVAAKGTKSPLRVDNHGPPAFESQWADWQPKEPTQRTDKTDKRSDAGIGICPPGGQAVLLQVPEGVPPAWVQGGAELLAMSPHSGWPEVGWRTLQEDALAFLRAWAAQAHALGWAALDLFGVHDIAPRSRLDGMGLVPLLNGRLVVALTEDSAAIKAESGGTLTFRRQRAWPLGRCPIWEL
jgi:hypothetical protein